MTAFFEKGLMMTSQKQIEANRRNARKSTGAITPAGKRRSSMNAIKHGVLSSVALLPHENPRDYSFLLDGVMQEFQPKGAYEQFLVDRIATAMWKQRRLAAAERVALEMETDPRAKGMQETVHRRLTGKTPGFTTILDYQEITNPDEVARDIEEEDIILKECMELEGMIEDQNHGKCRIDIKMMEERTPCLAEWLQQEAQDEMVTTKEWFRDYDIEDFCRECRKHAQNQKDKLMNNIRAQEHIKAARTLYSCPVGKKAELLQRYQHGLDKELYTAVEALRRHRSA